MIKYTNKVSKYVFIWLILITLLIAVVPVRGQSGRVFNVTRQGTSSTYQAISVSPPSSYTGSLKFVGESAATELNSVGGGTMIFAAGNFDFGTEFFKFENRSHIIIVGQGIDVTIISNFTDAAADTEPFNCSNCDFFTIGA